MILNVPDIDAHEQLAANRDRLIERMGERLAVFEARYELASVDLREALDSGVIRETAEVTEWLIVWGTYCALLDERSTLAE